MATKSKDITIKIDSDKVVGSEIMRSGSYKYASITAKPSDNQYIRVSFEWKDNNVPDTVLDIMKLITASEVMGESDEYKEVGKRMDSAKDDE